MKRLVDQRDRLVCGGGVSVARGRGETDGYDAVVDGGSVSDN